MSDLGNIVHLIKRDLGIQLATPLDNLNVQLTGYDTLDFSGKTFFVRGIDADILEYLTALQEHITPHQVTQP